MIGRQRAAAVPYRHYSPFCGEWWFGNVSIFSINEKEQQSTSRLQTTQRQSSEPSGPEFKFEISANEAHQGSHLCIQIRAAQPLIIGHNSNISRNRQQEHRPSVGMCAMRVHVPWERALPCVHAAVAYNEIGEDARDSQSFNELIEEQLFPLPDWLLTFGTELK